MARGSCSGLWSALFQALERRASLMSYSLEKTVSKTPESSARARSQAW